MVFMLLTRNNFWISCFGAIFIFLSSPVQWWSYTLSGLMIPLNLIFIALAYVLYSKNYKAISLAGLLLLVASFSFIVNLYPPWQVPLFYLYFFLLAGYVVKEANFKVTREKLWLRAGVVSTVLIITAAFLFHQYGLVKHSYEVLANTIYPGKRSTNGGGLVKGKFFSEFFGLFMGEFKHPQKLVNICEASNFIMFFPVIFLGMGYRYIREKKIDRQQMLLSILLIVFLIWIFLGFIPILSKVTLMSFSPSFRTLPVVGLANCFLLTLWLGSKKSTPNRKYPKADTILLSIITLGLTIFITIRTNNALDKYFSTGQLLFVCIFFTLVYLLVLYKDIKYAKLIAGLLIIGISMRNMNVNPITSGLSAALENAIVTATKAIYDKEPYARWAVFGNPQFTSFLKINGINVFNGVKHVPPIKDMRVLDSTGRNDSIYNRYAYIAFTNFIDWRDSLYFRLLPTNVDYYTIYMDACSPRLKALGVKYVLFTYQPQEFEIRCMSFVSSAGSTYIYKRKDE